MWMEVILFVCNNVDVFINFFNYLFELKLFLNFFFFNYVVYVIKSLCIIFIECIMEIVFDWVESIMFLSYYIVKYNFEKGFV